MSFLFHAALLLDQAGFWMSVGENTQNTQSVLQAVVDRILVIERCNGQLRLDDAFASAAMFFILFHESLAMK